MERCEYSWDCPFWAYCNGDKEYACKMNFCPNELEDE